MFVCMASDVRAAAIVVASAVIAAVIVGQQRRRRKPLRMSPCPSEHVVESLFVGGAPNDSARVRRVHFKPTVSVCHVENLQECMAELWWLPEDYAEFLRVRVEVGKAYRDVAKQRGIPLDSAFPPEPSLAHESRRGLGLGRKRQREKNRRDYIDAVLDEQARQRLELLAGSPHLNFGEHNGDDSVVPSFLLDTEKIAAVARQASESDLLHSIKQAELDYKLFLETEAAMLGVKLRRKSSLAKIAGASPEPLVASPAAPIVQPALPVAEKEDMPVVRRRLSSLVKAPSVELAPDSPTSKLTSPTMTRLISPGSDVTKGFGQSRELLAQAGLSATGHRLSRAIKPLKVTRGLIADDSDDSDMSGISDLSGGESDGCGDSSDASGPAEDADFVSEATDTTVPEDDGELGCKRDKQDGMADEANAGPHGKLSWSMIPACQVPPEHDASNSISFATLLHFS